MFHHNDYTSWIPFIDFNNFNPIPGSRGVKDLHVIRKCTICEDVLELTKRYTHRSRESTSFYDEHLKEPAIATHIMLSVDEDFFCEVHMMAVFESCIIYSAVGRDVKWTFMKISDLSDLVDNTSKRVKIELIPRDLHDIFVE